MAPLNTIVWSCHPGIINKPSVWQPRFASGWQRVEGAIDDLAAQIRRGEAFIAAAMTSDHRTAAAFAHADLAAVDIDNGLTVEEFLEHPLTKHAAFAYTTASHDPENGKHRFRVIFRLSSRVDDADLYKGITTILTRALGGDKSCTDPTRLFYACSTADIPLWQPDRFLPEEFIHDAIEVVERQKRIYDDDVDADPASIANAIFCLEQVIPPTEDGQRDRFIRITAAARAGGDELFPAWSDWASRGHHGSGSRSKQSSEKFFRGMRGTSLGTLFYFASDADPDWRRKLPEELRSLSTYRRGCTDAYAGYSYEDFLGDPEEPVGGKEAAYGLFDPDAPWAKVATPTPEPTSSDRPGYTDADFMGDDQPLKDPSTTPVKRGPGRPRKDSPGQVDLIMQRLRRLYPGLRLNVISQRLEFGPKETPQLVPDASTTYIRLSRGVKDTFPKTTVADLMQVVGYENRFNPVLNYLDQCLATNQPYPDFNRLATTLLGLSDDPLENPLMPDGSTMADAALKRFLIGAVARALRPGCTMDWIPILVGPQNLGKSQFFKYLVPPVRHDGDTPWVTTLQQGIAVIKDKPHMLHSGWLVILDEIERYFKRAYVEELKNLVSTSVDFSAKKYQNELHYPRNFVLAGATNSRDFLQDPTGNRRFMPILVKGVVPSLEDPSIKIIDLDRLKDHRDAIWAAAYQAFMQEEPWTFTSHELSYVSSYTASFSADSSLKNRVALELTRSRTGCHRGRSFITLGDLFKAMKVSLEHQPGMQRETTDALKALGWTMKRIRLFGTITRVWVSPTVENSEDSVTRGAQQPVTRLTVGSLRDF